MRHNIETRYTILHKPYQMLTMKRQLQAEVG